MKNVTFRILPAALFGLLMLPGAARAATNPCATMRVSTSYVQAPATGGRWTVAIQAPSTCTWKVGETLGWLSIVTAKSGSGNGSFVFQATANTTRNARRGGLNLSYTYTYSNSNVVVDTRSLSRSGVGAPALLTDTISLGQITVDQYGR